jgi:hypothetical protein
VGDIDKHRNRTLQIHHGVKFYGTLGATEAGPGKQRQTQIDRRRIEGIDGSLEIQSQIRFRIEWPSDLNEAVREVGVDSPVAILIGIGECGPSDRGTKTRMVQFSPMRCQTDFDIAEAFSMGQLCECHC